MSKKVTIIGAGNVGATIAYAMTVTGMVSEIVLIDVYTEKALGEAMDIRQGTPFCAPIKVYAGDYPDAAGSDVVVITSGIARRPGQSRIDLTQTNVNIIKSIAPQITQYAPDALYVIVSNPVDVLTYVFAKVSGIPESHIIGSGTSLDTARLRARLAEDLDISQKNVHAYVLGEHGDSSFVPWSTANIANIPLNDYLSGLQRPGTEKPVLDLEDIETFMRTSGAEVIKRKGATFYAVAISVCNIVSVLLGSTDTVLCVSTMMHGEYGIDDVCLSIPTLIGPGGIKGNVQPTLTEEEVAKLNNSANVLKGVIEQISL